MKVLIPISVTEAMLTSSTIAENEHAPWDSGTTCLACDAITSCTAVVCASASDETVKMPPCDPSTRRVPPTQPICTLCALLSVRMLPVA